MRDHRLYLKDIFEAMVAAQAFVEGMNFDAFIADDKTASAVVRKLEIIGEAAKNVPQTIRREYPRVPWQQMAGMRDRIIHRYFAVNHVIVWDTVKDHIPSLQPIIAQILKDLEEERA